MSGMDNWMCSTQCIMKVKNVLGKGEERESKGEAVAKLEQHLLEFLK